MEDVIVLLNIILSLWFFVKRRREQTIARSQSRLKLLRAVHRRLQDADRRLQDVDRRLQAARRNTMEKDRRVWEAITQYEVEDRMRRVMMIQELNIRTRRRPKAWELHRSSQWWDIIVPGFSDAQWLQNFRMSQQTFIYLCNKLRPALERQNTSFRKCVPLKKRVAIALWKLATGSEYRSIGHIFGVSITTVCRCLQEFCAAAELLLVPEQIRMPDDERFREMSVYIENRWGLPHCVGAIDGSHIPIIAPQHYHTDYFNRKGWHSIILQAVVDGKGQFWNVFAGLPGSMHDARVLRLSTLWELASRGNLFPAHIRTIGTANTGYYILGDAAYPLQDWLLKPFSDTGRLTAEQLIFNQKFSSTRVVVENAFGRLKGRWRSLLKRNDCDVQLVKSMVLTCCALHNLCESHGESYDTSLDEPRAEAATPPQTAVQQEVEGRDVRNALMEYLLSIDFQT